MVFFSSYDKGAYLVLRSFVMRTHGSKHQRVAVRRASEEQLKSVFEVREGSNSILLNLLLHFIPLCISCNLNVLLLNIESQKV